MLKELLDLLHLPSFLFTPGKDRVKFPSKIYVQICLIVVTFHNVRNFSCHKFSLRSSQLHKVRITKHFIKTFLIRTAWSTKIRSHSRNRCKRHIFPKQEWKIRDRFRKTQAAKRGHVEFRRRGYQGLYYTGNPVNRSQGQEPESCLRWSTREMCRPVFQILTLFQTKKCNFSHRFSDLASKPLKSTPFFRHIHMWLIREYPLTPPRPVLFPVYLSYLCQSLFFVKLYEVSTSKI